MSRTFCRIALPAALLMLGACAPPNADLLADQSTAPDAVAAADKKPRPTKVALPPETSAALQAVVMSPVPPDAIVIGNESGSAPTGFVSKMKSEGQQVALEDLPPEIREQLEKAMANPHSRGESLSQRWTGKAFPRPSLQSLSGETIALPGQRTVINFWATWCEPCVREMPLLERLQREEPDLRVITINNDIDSSELQRYLEASRMSLPVVPDQLSEIAQEIGVEVYPSTLVLAANGEVERVAVGDFDNMGKLREKLGLLQH